MLGKKGVTENFISLNKTITICTYLLSLFYDIGLDICKVSNGPVAVVFLYTDISLIASDKII